MVEKLEHPVPPEPHGLRGPRPPEPWEMVELRSIAEDLITALETEDRELKADAVVGVLSRFELKKPHFEPKPGHPKPFGPKPHGPKPGHPLPHELGHRPPEHEFEHPMPPIPGEHPEPPSPYDLRP